MKVANTSVNIDIVILLGKVCTSMNLLPINKWCSRVLVMSSDQVEFRLKKRNRLSLIVGEGVTSPLISLQDLPSRPSGVVHPHQSNKFVTFFRVFHPVRARISSRHFSNDFLSAHPVITYPAIFNSCTAFAQLMECGFPILFATTRLAYT
jgi:hypothetical protein